MSTPRQRNERDWGRAVEWMYFILFMGVIVGLFIEMFWKQYVGGGP